MAVNQSRCVCVCVPVNPNRTTQGT
jgi:hypothetical protein